MSESFLSMTIHVFLTIGLIANLFSILYIRRCLNLQDKLNELYCDLLLNIRKEILRKKLYDSGIQGMAKDTEMAK